MNILLWKVFYQNTYCISPAVSRPVSMRLDESLLILISSGVDEIPSLHQFNHNRTNQKKGEKEEER